MADVITVSALNRYVKTLLDSNDILFDLALQGEIANFTCNARSGHCYFSLRDHACSVKAVMFKTDARRLAFRPADGMRVVVRCRVTLYERDGAFQIYVSDMFPDGIGSAQLAFEQLKAKLEAEGLFSAAHKKEIPVCPARIGVVTSKTGAALQDIKNVLARRWSLSKVVLCPVNVQGFEAAPQIAAALQALDRRGKVDLIIVARGGGSREDLWVFNAEVIARAAFACKTPLISAIGHEIDFTILDFVADLRAPTPSAAAELAVPDRAEFLQKIYKAEQNIQQNMQKRLEICYNEMEAYPQTAFTKEVAARLDDAALNLQHQTTKLQKELHSIHAAAQQKLAHCAELMAALNPYHTLARGYACLKDEENHIVTVSELVPNQAVQLIGATTVAHCTVNRLEDRTDEDAQKL